MTLINLMHSGSLENGNLHVVSAHMGLASAEVRKRFRLKDDMKTVYKRIATDDSMRNSINEYRGMRLTVNDPWETTLVFIISQFNNVKRIRLITKNLVQKFGVDITDARGNVIAKGFPHSSDLMKATVQDFMQAGAGFRAKYIKEAVEYCTNNIDLNRLQGMKYEELKEKLMTISGVGEKVADCIALMGYGELEAFPIDVHVKRAVEKLYFKGRKRSIKQIQEFAELQWGKYRGYAQQYLFYLDKLKNI